MAEEVLVIGAGPAGIACAWFLEQAGIRYRVVDRAGVIASTWASQYPTLRLNTSRFFSHMPGRKFPLSFGIFPTARQYHDYLERFVDDHQLNIHLNVEVYRVAPQDDGWYVESSEGVAWYPAVVLATGRFSYPYQPPMPGIEQFSGQVLHSHDYKGAQDFAGQRVMVIGNGPSGVDIACALTETVRLPVYLAQRTGIVLRPRYPYGLPKHAWMLLAEALPNRFTHWLDHKAQEAQYRHVERSGIKVPAPGQESGAAGTRGPELIRAAQRGQVQSVAVPVDFEDRTALLADGSHLELDTVILATGFYPKWDYLDIDFAVDEQGLPVREPRDFPVYAGYKPHTGYEVEGHPGLYVAGIFYQGKGAMFNFNVEGEIIVQQIQSRLAQMPDREPSFVPEMA
ncbi:MAG: hypothetical protein CL610_27985 [Anaerolineaceae bacterium]|nr:hypothetical protein [Anaerolineaceae bacterium]